MNKKNFKTLAEKQRKILNIEKDSPLYDGWQLGIQFADDYIEKTLNSQTNEVIKKIEKELVAQCECECECGDCPECKVY